ncbi:MAG: hypothetical protein ACREOO_02760, partial [bacterium]
IRHRIYEAEHLGVASKAKHENEPEKIKNPKQAVRNLFEQCHKRYTSQHTLILLPQLRIQALLCCRHFKELL